jgi:hypothetical protein
MSRAAVKAKQRQRAAERGDEKTCQLMARVDERAAVDAVLVRCERCGLVQVSPALTFRGELDVCGCPVCGCETGSFVDWLPGNAVAANRGGRQSRPPAG